MYVIVHFLCYYEKILTNKHTEVNYENQNFPFPFFRHIVILLRLPSSASAVRYHCFAFAIRVTCH